MTDTHLTSTRFDGFALDARILAGLADAGFSHCTPIQAETLPPILRGEDIAGQAQTGTGKTAAFLVGTLQRLLSVAAPEVEGASRICRPRALILAPTRELAVQIHRDAVTLAAHSGLRLGLVFGGTGYQDQRESLAAGVDILIGTPGRLIDYYKQRVFDLSAIEVVVLDEADRMFDLGFIKDIRFLLRRMPPPEARLGMLFSATLSYRVTELAYEHMNQPRLVKIETEQVTAERVLQRCYMTANEEKIPLLLGLARPWVEAGARIIVFVNTKREADRVWGYLQGNGVNTAVLSGDVPQKQRLRLLRDFTEGRLPVLVGTDVAARGLHIPGVTHVVNYDLPSDPEDYVHRIGRTARAGATGEAISFVCETHAFSLPDIESYIGARIPVEALDPALLVAVDPASRLRQPRSDEDSRGRRPSSGRAGAGRERSRRTPEAPRAESPAASPGEACDTPAFATTPAKAASAAPAHKAPKGRQPETAINTETAAEPRREAEHLSVESRAERPLGAVASYLSTPPCALTDPAWLRRYAASGDPDQGDPDQEPSRQAQAQASDSEHEAPRKDRRRRRKPAGAADLSPEVEPFAESLD